MHLRLFSQNQVERPTDHAIVHICREMKSVIRNTGSLTAAHYDAEVMGLLASSVALDTTYASDCLQQKGLGFYVPETTE